MRPKRISYKQLLREVQAIEKDLSRALKNEPAAQTQQKMTLDLKAFATIEKDVRARCFGVIPHIGHGGQLPARARGRGRARKRPAK